MLTEENDNNIYTNNKKSDENNTSLYIYIYIYQILKSTQIMINITCCLQVLI
jgi:hypothetical protein